VWQVNYIREAEQYLYHYRDLKRAVKNIDRQIERLSMAFAPSGYPQPALDGMPHGGGHREEIENVAYQIMVLRDSRERTLDAIANVEQVLLELGKEPGCEQYPAVLELWYGQKIPPDEIADKLNYSRRNIYYLRNYAVKKFAVNLFGIKAV
jgi:hypothetical protein